MKAAAMKYIFGPLVPVIQNILNVEQDTNMVDVDFEWFDPQPDVDFHGIKTLLRQLFDNDSQILDLSALTNLVLAQPLLGSTVKVDGNETDPYAFLTVLNIKEHLVWTLQADLQALLTLFKDNPAVHELRSYLAGRAAKSTDPSLTDVLKSDAAKIGLILTERLINIPSEVVPPMYKMLLEEVQWAVEAKEPYDFSHFLILSKTYQEVDSTIDEKDESIPKHKKRKKANKEGSLERFYFHPEDEVLHKFAVSSGDFDYFKEAADGQSDSKRAFQEMGIKTRGHMILIEAIKFEAAIKAIQSYFGQS